MSEYFSVRFVDLILMGKSFLDYANLFSNGYEKNDKVILKYF